VAKLGGDRLRESEIGQIKERKKERIKLPQQIIMAGPMSGHNK